MFQVIRLTYWDCKYNITPIGVFSTHEKAYDAMMQSVHDCETANSYCDPDYGEEDEEGFIHDGGCISGPLDDNKMNWGFVYGYDDYSAWYIIEVKEDEVNLYEDIEFGMPDIKYTVSYQKEEE